MKQQSTLTNQVKTNLLFLMLLLAAFKSNSQSVTLNMSGSTTFCEGSYKTFGYSFTPPSNVYSWQITAVKYYRNGQQVGNWYNGAPAYVSNGYCYALQSSSIYVIVEYSYKTTYQYQCGSYCCQTGPFGNCTKTCYNYCTGYNTYNNSVYSSYIYVTMKPKSATTQNVTVCSNTLPYIWNGYNIDYAGTYNKTLYNSVGCDSVVTLNLTVGTSGATSYDSASVCSSALPYSWNGMNLTTAGDYSKNFTSATGCDSVANFKLAISAANTSANYATICSSALPYLWNGITCDSTGIYSKTFNSPTGCDSVAVLNLTINPTTSSITNIVACENAVPFWWNNHLVNVGTDTVYLTNATGCDSLAIVNVTTKPVGTSTRTVGISQSQFPYAWNNYTYGEAGTYVQHFTTYNGCDSVATLILVLNLPTTSTTNIGICQTQFPYTWNGNTYTTAGTYVVHLTNSKGADSAATLNLSLNTTSSTAQNINVCQTSLPYLWNGNSYTTSGNYGAHFNNSKGCDSTVTLNLTVNASTSSTTNVATCQKYMPYHWNGATFTSGGTYLVHISNSKGCDSAATLNLAVVPEILGATINASQDSICLGTPVTFKANPICNPSTATIASTFLKYSWRKNGVEVSRDSAYTDYGLLAGDTIVCVMLSTDNCNNYNSLMSNKINVKVKTSTNYPYVMAQGQYSLWSSTDPKNGVIFKSIGTICNVTDKFNLSATKGGAWTVSDSTVISLQNLSSATGTATGTLKLMGNGTAKVIYTTTLSNGCSFASGFVVSVDTTPVAPIIGPSKICVGQGVTFTCAHPTGGVWQSYNNRIIGSNGFGVPNSTGYFTGVTASNGADAMVRYISPLGSACTKYRDYYFSVMPKPAIPTIGYAPGIINPQTGPNGAFCSGRTFTVTGNPSGGTWSVWQTPSTHIAITSAGVVTTIPNGSSSNNVSITYVYTNPNGCVNSRTITGTVANCAASRGTIMSNELLVNSNDFTMYPNPARSLISLNVNTLIGAGSIVVTDLYGKQIKMQTLSMGTNTIDVSKLSKGMYFVSVITSEGKTTKKLVVE